MSSSCGKETPSGVKSEEQDGCPVFDIEPRPASPAPSSRYSNIGLDRGPQGGGRRKFWPSKIKSVLWYFKDQWFLLALGVLIAIASQFQVPASRQQLKETVVTYLCVSIIFLMTGCTLPTRTLIQNYSRWKLHFFVQVQCFLMTSAILFGVVSAAATNKNFMDPGLLIGELIRTAFLDLETDEDEGLIFSGCIPTTISSNVVVRIKYESTKTL
jgi:sodium/bile acid cotransporter 7